MASQSGTAEYEEILQQQANDLRHLVSHALEPVPGQQVVLPPTGANANQLNYLVHLIQQVATQNQQTNYQIQQLAAHVATHNQQTNNQIQELRVDLIAQMKATFLPLRMAFNRRALESNDRLIPFPNQNGEISVVFPNDINELQRMSGPDMTELLQSYNITPIPHELAARRERVRQLVMNSE